MADPARHLAIHRPDEPTLPLQWREFIRFCSDMKYGEIERLAIQNGLPVIAEITKKKVRFTADS